MSKQDEAQSVRVGLVQMRCAENAEENMQKALKVTRDRIDAYGALTERFLE